MKHSILHALWLILVVAQLALAAPSKRQAGNTAGTLTELATTLPRSRGRVVLTEPNPRQAAAIKLTREWEGTVCRSFVANQGQVPVRLKEVVLFDLPHRLSAGTSVYGEGFTMLSQTAGTLGDLPGSLIDVGNYTDRSHYKIPEPEGARAVYGLLTLTEKSGRTALFGFTSSRRFVGKFYLAPGSIQVVVDCENLVLAPGTRWELEEFQLSRGANRNALLEDFAARINQHHPRLTSAEPTGWCSWYCFGPRVTSQNVRDNLAFIARRAPQLKYIQIDDGYQPHMGDWLDSGPSFGGQVQGVLRQIREAGFEPAIWVAPFIADKDSRVFNEHPDWFVQDAEGKPLRSDAVTFGGWRMKPWYVLDGTHPAVQRHLEQTFRTMREQWGCTYFKLDANFWGAIHGGSFHDPRATRVEAYRRGMEPVLRGAGDAFILGCNHPIWPSLGLIHGSRSSGDIKRTWKTIKTTGRENLWRNWQNGRLWWNDPDAVVLTGDLPEKEFVFHATVIYASGGMVLSGDDLTAITPERLRMLQQLLPPHHVAARFADETLNVGELDFADHQAFALFNWGEQPESRRISLRGRSRVRDFWTGEDLGEHDGEYVIQELAGHAAKLLIATPVKR